MVFSQGPKWHLLSLLLACLAGQVLSQSVSGAGCESSIPGCEPPKVEGDSKSLEPQTCSAFSSKQRYIGQYRVGSNGLDCDGLEPSDINVEPWTHLFMDFNPFPINYTNIVGRFDERYHNIMFSEWKSFTDLKIKKPSLKTYMSVQQYWHHDEGWPTVVRSSKNRTYFIDSFTKLMEEFKFDGLNLDLTEISSPDYIPEVDAKHFPTLLKELRESFGDKYGLSATIVATECALKGHNLAGLAEHVDFLNIVPYGPYDNCADKPLVPEVDAAFDIESSLELLRKANIDPNKLSLTLRLEGHIHRFEDPKCLAPGCSLATFKDSYSNHFYLPECTLFGFHLTGYELERAVERWSPDVHFNESGAYSWFLFSDGKHDDQLVIFYNAQALKKRADLANRYCLGGLFVWEISYGGPATLANPNDLDPSDTSMRGARLTKPYNGTNGRNSTEDMPSATSIQSDSLSTETSNNDTDTNANTEGLSCHPAIGSVHVPIAQQDCDSDSTSTAAHEPGTPVNAEEHTPSPTLAAPHEAGTSDEPNAIGPKPTLPLAHRIGTPSDTAEKANDEGTTPGEPTITP